MTRPQSTEPLTLEIAHVDSLGRDTWKELVALCTTAFDQDFRHALGMYPDSTHVLARLDDRIVSHACWVGRSLQAGDLPALRTAYVEHVATLPAYQSRGFGSAVMERLVAAIEDFELGALATGRQRFYAPLGWQSWRGPLAIRTDGGLVPVPGGGVMVLRLPLTPELDLDQPLTAEWREGEPW
jgi:GNAT superfamily N-acetyltransferase